ncbi:trehalose-6-phosphate hydrolase [Actinobacillus equuli]|nr:trehalose-6-phosphate hydrolase [Actinobacillus equuli]
MQVFKGKPWIDVAKNFRDINVEQALADKDSVFYTYQSLIALRKELAVLTDGNYTDLLPEHPLVWAYRRQTAQEMLTVVANLSAEKQLVNIETSGRILMNNYQQVTQTEQGIWLEPYQSIYFIA